MTCFRFHKLCTGYKGKDILTNLSGEIREGTVTALLGKNGSGKSTLLKALGGFIPCRGEIFLRDRPLPSLRRQELGRLIGAMAQSPAPAMDFTVREVVAMGRLPFRPLLSAPSRQDREAVIRAAVRARVEHLLDRPVTELSGGERQRVFLAMVLAQDAPILLLDEPTSAMDPGQAASVFALFRELAREGKTIVAAVHDINGALSCSDFFLGLREGRLISQGPLSDISDGILRPLYGADFTPYRSSGGDCVWHACSPAL